MHGTLQNAGRFAVFAGWTGALVWLLLSGDYADFLHPRFWPLIAVGAVILEGFLLAGLPQTGRHHARHGSKKTCTTGLVVLVPVLFCFAIPNLPLGSHYLAKRASTLERWAGFPGAKRAGSIRVVNGLPYLDLLAVYGESARHIGREIVVDGFVFRPVESAETRGPTTPSNAKSNEFHLCRFVMTCCAADAMPLTLRVDWSRSETLRNDSWVRVQGVLDLAGDGQSAHPVLRALAVEPIVRPASPYLYLALAR